mmetsp:Transcript_17055/g.36787  ORF Transcript_17055/g.36787 Transcript_17055/m.36787 type:complete len:412 (-) Transcript_17055:1120-2355(-)
MEAGCSNAAEGRNDEQQQQQQHNPYHLPPRGQQEGHPYDARQQPHQSSRRQNSFNGGEEMPSEKSSLLPPSGIRTYESREGEPGDYSMYGMDSTNSNNGVWGSGVGGVGSGGTRHPYPPTPRGVDSKKKKSKRRRREREKRRQPYFSDSSEEDASENRRGTSSSGRHHHHHHHAKSKKSKSKSSRGHGKRRSQADGTTPSHSQNDESLSETYSESRMSLSSLADRSRSREAKGPIQQFLIFSKLLVYNLPLSSAAISFSIVLLGIVWLKWAEEMLPSCKEVNFHSSQCSYPEFPGCYFCDEYNPWYRLATQFHTVCSYIAGTSVLLFFAKATLCWRVFMDEMSSPTTASPMGLVFMTMALSFVGKGGDVGFGAVLVFIASFLHLVLVVWFIYMSLAYQTMPDPSCLQTLLG